MTACKYWDCGWCYAPDYLKTNSINSTCVDPNKCPISPLSEPTQYETPMTENEEEIEKVKAQIKVLEKKLSFLEEIEKQPKTLFDVIRNLGYSVDACYEIVDAVEEFQKPKEKEQKWDAVRESVKWCEEHPDKDPLDWLKPQTPEQVADGLKEAFREAIKQGIIPEIKQPTDELIEKLVKKPPEFLKFELGKTLTDLIYQWWGDVFTTHSDWDMETSIEDLVDQIQMWLPKEQSAAGSQSLGVEDMVEGFNDAIKKIKSKLRNKKDT